MERLSRPFLASAIILVVTLACYSDTLNHPYHFDDGWSIIDNESIRDIWDLPAIWEFNPSRFLTFLSLAFNYHFGELDVLGYHVFNIVIHFLNGFIVYWLCGLLLASPNSFPRGDQGSWSPPLVRLYPLFVALIFVAHPIQTESVTYLWQRNTSLATMFYLLSMALYVKSALLSVESGRKSHYFLAGALLAGFAATITKQISVTLPVAIVLMEYFFISPSMDKLKSKTVRLSLFIPVLMVIPVMTVLGMGNELTDMAVRQKNVLGSFEYLTTQFNVIVMYIKLLFLPIGLNLDYDYPPALLFSDYFLSLATLLALVGLAFWLFEKNRIASFGIIFFFLSISVESSIFPLHSLDVVEGALVEAPVAEGAPGEIYQFERTGYFVHDIVDSRPGKPVLNRIVTLRDSWARIDGRELVLLQGDNYAFSELGSGWAPGTSRRQWLVLAQRRNTANDRFPARPKGGTQMSQYCVTALKKDWAILCGLRLVLEHLGASEPAIITLKKHQ